MKATKLLVLGMLLTCLCAMAQASPDPHAAVPSTVSSVRIAAIVRDFRKIAVLTYGTEALDRSSRTKVEALTWTLSQENQGRLADLLETFSDDNGVPVVSKVQEFLDTIEKSSNYTSCDRLAFEPVLDALFSAQAQFPADFRQRIAADLSAVRRIKPPRSTEPGRGTRKDRKQFLEATGEWERYVAALEQNLNRKQLLQEHASILPSR